MAELMVRSYQDSDREAVIQLWRDCGLVVPWNDPEKDVQRKLASSERCSWSACSATGRWPP